MFPSRLNRVILWDVLKIFLLATITSTVLLSVVLVGKQLISEGVGWLALVQFLPFICMIALQFSVPITFLFSVVLVYSRISADNEFLALKSVGISPTRLIRPIMITGLLASVPAVWINELAVSWAEPGIERVVIRSIKEIIYGRLKTQRSYESDKGFTVHVQDVQGDWLIGPTVFFFDQGSGRPTTLTAERARIIKEPGVDRLVLELEDAKGQTSQNKETTFDLPGLEWLTLRFDREAQKGVDSIRPSQFAMQDIPAEIGKQIKQNDRIKEEMALQACVGLGMGRYNQLSDGSLHSYISKIEENKKRLNRLRLEPYRRWSFGTVCFFFVWLGVPFAIWKQSAEYAWTFGICIVLVFAYFVLFFVSLDRVKAGAFPVITLFAGNLFLFVLGAWFRHKIVNT